MSLSPSTHKQVSPCELRGQLDALSNTYGTPNFPSPSPCPSDWMLTINNILKTQGKPLLTVTPGANELAGYLHVLQNNLGI